MEYKEAFKRLEKKNQNKAYWIDLCRRDNLSFFDFPIWFGLILIAVGIFINKIVPSYVTWLMEGTGLSLIFVGFVFSSFINEKYKKVLIGELK